MEEITSFGISPIVYWIIGGVVIAILLIIFAVAAKKMFRKAELYGMSREEIKKKWQTIEEMARRNDEMSYKLAVMEADKLLDHVLKALGFGGSTLAERLKLAAYRYPNIRNVWPAHLARNRMVHEASYHLNGSTAQDAIRRFRDALNEFGVL